MSEGKTRRWQDMEYDAHIYCSKSYDDKHHFTPRASKYSGRRSTKFELRCVHCDIQYIADLHMPPEGYEPLA